jgi:hypothetical protein
MRNKLWQGLTAITLATCMWSPPARADLNEGLITYLKLNEGSGSSAHDSADSHDGDIYGARWVAGVCGSALDFDGVDDYVAVAGLFDQFGGTQPFSLCAWIMRTTVGGDEPYILNNMYSSWQGIGLFSDGENTAVTVGGADGGVGQGTARYHMNLVDGDWHMIVGTYDTSGLQLYIDGEPKATDDTFGTYTASYWSMNIGRMEQGDRYYFDGAVDEVRIYERALSADEVQQLYCSACPKIGDMNCDCGVDGFDIDPFFLALGHEAKWHEQYPACNIMNGDINGDGYFDGFDIDPFFALLQG